MKEQENTYVVYVHQNNINGKRYVGITQQLPEKRWRKGREYRGCVLFYKAIKRYGWNNFTHYIIAYGLSKDEATKMEQDLIAKFKSNNHEFGYNLTSGGEHFESNPEVKARISKSLTGKKHAEEAKRKIAQTHIGVPRSAETKEKISKSLMGHPCSRKGTHLSKEQMENVIKARGKRVMCVETGQIFRTVTEAARLTGTHRQNISHACNGKLKTTNNCHWQYV